MFIFTVVSKIAILFEIIKYCACFFFGIVLYGWCFFKLSKLFQIKSSLYSPYYAEAYNEWRGPSLRHCAWAAQLRRNVATMASRWRHCADLIGSGIEHRTSRANSVCLATELMAGSKLFYLLISKSHVFINLKLLSLHKISCFKVLVTFAF